MSITAVVFGETLARQRAGRYVADGSPFLLAAYLARMGNESALITRLGMDNAGDMVNEQIAACGISTEYLQRDRVHPTAMMETSGSTIAENAACRYIAPGTFPARPDVRIDVFCFQTCIQCFDTSASSLWRFLNDSDAREVFYGINLHGKYYTKSIFERSMEAATIVGMRETERDVVSMILFGSLLPQREFCEELSRCYVIPVVYIRDENKCSVYHAGSFELIRGKSTGMNNAANHDEAFHAAFLSCFTRPNKKTAFESVRIAIEIGALVTEDPEGLPSYPDAAARLIA